MSDAIQEVEIRETFGARGLVTPAGKFEILAITAGDGNGWQFSEAVLRDSMELWDGLACFVDHAGFMDWTRSVKDLGGVCRNPRWDPESQGILMDLQTLGPSGPLVDELGRELLSAGETPAVGFSADVVFTAKGAEVQSILRVLDLSLVFNPARGGAFKRALNSAGLEGISSKEVCMSEQVVVETAGTASPPAGGTMATQLQGDLQAVRELLTVQQERDQIAAEVEAARTVRLEMCKYLLDSGLAASRLPGPMQEHVRARFQDRVFEPGELTAAIDEARDLVSRLAGGSSVVGPRISAVYSTEDQLQAAVDDLLGAPRENGARVARLSGVRELYLMLTGDVDLHGGYHPERTQLATTANFTGIIKNALNKIVATQWEQLGAAGYDWWMRVTSQEHFETVNTVTGTLVGTVGTLPTVAEGAEYTELKIGDSPETATFYKYGGYIPLTLELIDRDETRKLAAYPRELAKAGIRKISALVAAVFSSNSGVGPTMADTGALFNSTAVSTAGGHANLRTTALSATEWDTVANAVYSQPLLIANETSYYGSGPALGIDPKYCLVPRELALTAKRILYPEWEYTTQIYSENMLRGEQGDVVIVPDWTDANDWAAVVDPRLMSGIVICERFGLMPEIFIAGDELSPAVFMNDEHRIKVRHFLAVLVQDFRPLHKNNVT